MGCDMGFGCVIVIKLDKMGVCVLVICLMKEGEQSLKLEVSDKLKIFQMDVINFKQIKDVYEEIKMVILFGKIINIKCEEILKDFQLVFCKYLFCKFC